MKKISASRYIELMRDQIDLARVPFSDRGSRLLLYSTPEQDAFYLRLAERLEALQPGLETHRARPPFLSDIALLDADGRQLKFELETYPHVVHCQTRIGHFNLAFHDHDTLAVGLPAGVAAGIQLIASNLFRASKAPESDPINRRRVDLWTNTRTLVQSNTPCDSGMRMQLIAGSGQGAAIHISLLRGTNAPGDVPQFPDTLTAARARWEAWFERVPPVEGRWPKAYAYAWWAIANNLVAPLGRLHYEAMLPSKAQYLGVWNWDACFHAIALRHIDPRLARDQLRTVLDAQCEDGMLPDVVHDEGIVDHIEHPIPGRVTKPPVMAWAALKIQEIDPDLEFLREIYPALKRSNRWWFKQRGNEVAGLAHYQHPYSSGLDDSPMWDHGFPVVAPDLNTYLAIEMDALAAISERLDLADEARAWRVGADQIVGRMLDKLYDPAQGFFWPTHAGKTILERTPFNLYPLWTGRMPPDVEAQLIRNLTDPEMFWGPHPLRTVARDTKPYSPTTMWRGPVWINVNYIFVEALERVGRSEQASELRRRTIELVAGNPGFYEFYNPEDGTAPARAAPTFGWTAALFIDLCLQEWGTVSPR